MPFSTQSHSHFKCQLLLFLCPLGTCRNRVRRAFSPPPNSHSSLMPLFILSYLACTSLGFISSLFIS